MKAPGFVLTALALVALSVYLFVSAPPPLAEAATEATATIPIRRVLETVAAENAAVRALYTREIVDAGKAAGLKFDEKWREPEVQAGPLPALFLREAAQALQRSPVPLGLFLGSDFPIAAANRFEGQQTAVFERMKQTRAPEFFYAEDTGLHTGMFPDVANVKGCVSCHNEHRDSPKTDWMLDDLMGAATWTYPKGTVSRDEYLRIVGAVRESFRAAYGEYLKEVESFDRRPEIGDRWPRDGYYLPSLEVFMEEFARTSSPATVDRLLLGDSTAPAPGGSTR